MGLRRGSTFPRSVARAEAPVARVLAPSLPGTTTLFRPYGHFRFSYNLYFSAYFFSRNSVFLSQQFSRNSVFQPVQPKFRPANEALESVFLKEPFAEPSIPNHDDLIEELSIGS